MLLKSASNMCMIPYSIIISRRKITCNRSSSISIGPYNARMRSHLVRRRCIERQFLENPVRRAIHSLLQLYHPLAEILAESVQAIKVRL